MTAGWTSMDAREGTRRPTLNTSRRAYYPPVFFFFFCFTFVSIECVITCPVLEGTRLGWNVLTQTAAKGPSSTYHHPYVLLPRPVGTELGRKGSKKEGKTQLNNAWVILTRRASSCRTRTHATR